MDLKLAGKAVLITGSSRGIGLATGKAFAAEGCRIMLSTRSAEQLREAEAALRGILEEALVAGSVDEVVEQFRSFEELGYTDILVRHLTNYQPKVLGSLDRLTAVRAALA